MENRNLTDRELDAILGGVVSTYEKFRTLSIDNGTDLVGTGATGAFIEKKYNQETSQKERIPFANSLKGIILASRASLIDKAKVPTWMSGEFDPSNTGAQIEIMPLSQGKFIKDANGTIKKGLSTYSEIKRTRKINQPDGTVQSSYIYFVVLYVLVEKEIIKLKFKGTSRGNFFDYNKELGKLGAKMYNIYTLFSTYVDRTTGKYAVKFSVKTGQDGQPVQVNQEEIREYRVKIANHFLKFTGNHWALKEPDQPAITQQQTITSGVTNTISELNEQDIPVIDIEDDKGLEDYL
jgi:hypothetical protein